MFCVLTCSLLTAECPCSIPDTMTSTVTPMMGVVEKGHCRRGKRGHRGPRGRKGKHGKRGHTGPPGPEAPFEYFASAYSPVEPVTLFSGTQLPLGSASLISSGIVYNGLDTVTVNVPGKYLVEYAFSFKNTPNLPVPTHLFIDTQYGPSGVNFVRDSFPEVLGRDVSSYIGSRQLLLNLQEHDIVRLGFTIEGGVAVDTDAPNNAQSIVFTMTQVE